MRAALTVWEGRVSPVFDVSREAEILTVEKGELVARYLENIEAPTSTLKVNRLLDLGVDTLVCGAISEPVQRELTTRGVRVLGFVAGEIDEVLRAFLAGSLPAPALSMPGYYGKQKGSRRERSPGKRGSGSRGSRKRG
jgi:predicted Fe-Mo cluster-binding NifX family protein